MKKIGLIGGTFDPIHYGHLVLAEQARDGLGLEKVIFMPTKRSPFKISQKSASAHDRYTMVSLAIEGNPGFEISDLEISGPEVSYTIHTLETCQRKLGQEYKIHFICGTDAFISMEGWLKADELLRSFPLIVGSRPKYKGEKRDEVIRRFTEEYDAKIEKIHIPKIDISSSDIKKRINEGRSVRYLLPEAVADYIEFNRLYLTL